LHAKTISVAELHSFSIGQFFGLAASF